jgi:hypothetical protein
VEGSLYTKEIWQYVRTLPFPKHFVMDTTEVLSDNPFPHLLFIIYRDNMLSFGEEDLLQIANSINEMMRKLRSDGVPCFLRTLPNRQALDEGT